jgi:oligopeptide/dipeptide ABC transporter ATP-binding protein
MTAEPVLRVDGLSVSASASGGRPGKPIVREVSFDVQRGEVVAIVGESGSGKSTVCLSVLRLLAPNLSITTGRIDFGGRNLVELSDRALRKIRGSEIGVILQDPLSSLDPVRRIGFQLTEARRLHRLDDRAASSAWATTTLTSLGFNDPEHTKRAYPTMLSGGMRQRVCVGIAFSGAPRLVLADEPTTALDVSLQGRLLRLLVDQKNEHGTSILLVSHDVQVVSSLADRVIVMYGGRTLEMGPTKAVLRDPVSPYTRALMRTVPTLNPRGPGERLPTIPLARTSAAVAGCPFAGRCENEIERCRLEMPPLEPVAIDHAVACWNPRGTA